MFTVENQRKMGLKYFLMEEFREVFLGKKFLYISQDIKDMGGVTTDNLVALEDLDHYFLRRLRASEVRLVKLGEQVSPYSYIDAAKPGYGKTKDDDHLVDVRRVLAGFGNGYTVVLYNAESMSVPLYRLVQSMEKFFRCRVQVNMYLTPAQAQGLPLHHDKHDVIIYQVHGCKEWVICGTDDRKDVVRGELDETQNSDSQTIELGKNDVLYLPKGLSHYAKTGRSPSVHVTFGFTPPSIPDLAVFVFNEFREQISEASELFVGNSKLDEVKIKDILIDSICYTKKENILSAAVEKFVSTIETRNRPAPGTLISLLAGYSIDQHTMMKFVSHVSPKLVDALDIIKVNVGLLSYNFPKEVKPLLDIMLSSKIFRISDVQGINGYLAVSIASKLVKDGLLVIVD